MKIDQEIRQCIQNRLNPLLPEPALILYELEYRAAGKCFIDGKIYHSHHLDKIPVINCMGLQTGRIYSFSLYTVLPEKFYEKHHNKFSIVEFPPFDKTTISQKEIPVLNGTRYLWVLVCVCLFLHCILLIHLMSK